MHRLLVVSSLLSLACVASPPELEVHEWGTFTTVGGEDGRAVSWLSHTADLPHFVYGRAESRVAIDGEPQPSPCAGVRSCIAQEYGKGAWRAVVRMETPVLYFYAARAMNVSAKVSFPSGRMTEWYPAVVNADDKTLDWGTLRVEPGSTPKFPTEPTANHYYAAREVDAAPLKVTGQAFQEGAPGCQLATFSRGPKRCVITTETTEWERFLFYRGVADFEPPMTATLNATQVTVTAKRALGDAFLFERRGDRVGFTRFEAKASRRELLRPVLTGTVAEMREALVGRLVQSGLFEKEARAMVKTWDDSWFEEGTRVFYLVPREQTDELLPLTVQPAPQKVVRTMVGRFELFSPEALAAVSRAVAQVPADSYEAAAALSTKLGRFGPALLDRALVHASAQERARFASPGRSLAVE